MTKHLFYLITVLLMGCGNAPEQSPTDPGQAEQGSNPVCLAHNSAYYLSFQETSGTCGSITGVYFTTDGTNQITPGGNSGLSCTGTASDGCSLTGPTCTGGTSMKIDSFQLTLTDPAQGSGTMTISMSGCSSTYSLTLSGS